MIKVDLGGANAAPDLQAAVSALKVLKDGTGKGNDFIGWVGLPENYDRVEFARIKAAAERVRENAEAFVIIGIGGSYLGARAAIEFLRHGFYNEMTKEARKTPQIYYIGNSMNGTYIEDVIDLLEGKDFSINVISKSGTTTETAIAFRVFRELLIQKYGKEAAAKRIYATTDKARGALKTLADTEGYECFVIPDDVGGRFSVLTAVGLLPIAVSGADIDALMAGAAAGREVALNKPFEENPALQYAAVRNILNRKGKTVEILANYEPSMHYISEWWKQLYGESEGKDNKGILPASVEFTADLHSMGQYIQQGPRNLMESIVHFNRSRHSYPVPGSEDNADGLNYIAGRDLAEICNVAAAAVREAHIDGGVPNIVINCSARDEEGLAELIGFFELACALSGYMSGVNPFDQPGVEAYKKNMFRMLGKPGAV